MSQQSCNACNDLREYAPEFVINGVTDNVCEHLADNEGLSGADAHNDCDDLHDVNDCLIGNMDDELESFEICEWKDFMHQYIPNNYETLKAMICSMCGQWEMIEDHEERIDALCSLLDSVMEPPVNAYGTLPKSSATQRQCGTIPTKNGRPIMIARSNIYTPGTEQYELFNRTQNVGIFYATKNIKSCSTGACQKHEWIYPSTHWYTLSEDAALGDVLWYVSKSTLQSVCGFSDYLWHGYTVSSWTWKTTPVESGADKGKYLWLKLTVDPGGRGSNYFGIELVGTSYPNSAPGYDAYVMNMTQEPMHYVSSC